MSDEQTNTTLEATQLASSKPSVGPTTILIVTNQAVDVEILARVLNHADDGPFDTEHVSLLSDALVRITDKSLDAVHAVLVDLTLPDSTGLATFDALYAVIPHVPIVTISGAQEEHLARLAVERGSQGYLSKGHFESSLVPQALRNIIQRKAVEQLLYREKARAEITLNSISDAVIGTDINGNVDYLNISAELITGWTRAEAQGMPITKIFRIVEAAAHDVDLNPVEMVLDQNKVFGLAPNTILIKRNGEEVVIEDSASPIHDSDGMLIGAVVVFHDVSVAKAMTAKMAYLAQHDFLTNLPNRVLLNDRIAQVITQAKRQHTQLAVLFLDLDNFKNINDSLGHSTGDALLISVSQRLSDCVRSSDTVSRQGGDEFVILLGDGKDEEDAAVTANKILTMLALPHHIHDSELHVTTSIGISLYPDDGKDAETLIKNADTAMYHAKEKGRNNYQFFRADMNVRAVERQFIEANLRRALQKQEFILHYQPKVNLKTGKITGVEALVRWNHPDWGVVMPVRFMAIAEECGLIIPLGRWVLKEACKQAKQWRDDGLDPVSIAVNISALEFRQKNFFEGVRDVLIEAGLEPTCLELEITESVLMSDPQASADILQRLKDMGVSLAVDDFGTGYSSLSYLKQFPIDVLKIDQSFVNDIAPTTDSGIIVSAVIGMGNSLKLRVIAEGVESSLQLAFLREQDCEEAQGYLLSRPLLPEDLATLLAKGMPPISSM